MRQASTAVAAIGFMTMIYVAFVYVEAATYRSTFTPADTVGSGERSVDAPPVAAAPIAEGTVIGEIEVQRLGLIAPIGQGESTGVLRRGVGHLADTAWLGQRGNVVLAGHRDTVFRGLRNIRVGDVINVATPNRRVQYAVRSMTVVSPDNLDVIQPSSANTLTLVTCFPFDFFGAAPKRFVVQADEIR